MTAAPTTPHSVRRRGVGARARDLLALFSPRRLVLGPVFSGQMRVAGRRPMTYGVRFIYGAILTFIAVVSLISVGMMLDDESNGNGSAVRLQTLQAMAPGLFVGIGVFQFVALALIGPVPIGPSLGDERRTGALVGLLTTPLKPIHIVVSRLAAQMVNLCVLAGLSVPLLLALRVFGGVPAEGVVGVTLLSLSTAALGAALSMLYSLGVRAGSAAAVAALGTQIMLAIAGPLTAVALGRLGVTIPGQWIAATCPPAAMAMLTTSLVQGLPFFGNTTLIWSGAVGMNLVIAAVVCVITAARLRSVVNVSQVSGRTARRAVRARAERARAVRTPEGAEPLGQLSAPEASSRTSSREVGDRPVLWRAWRTGLFPKLWQGVVAVAALVGLLAWVYSELGFDEQGVHMAVVAIGTVLWVAAAAVLPAPAIAGERENRTWDVLRTTPITARSLLLGKFAGVVRQLWLIPTMLVIHVVCCAALGDLSLWIIPHIAMVWAPTALLVVCTGLLISSMSRKPSQTAAGTLAVFAALWIGSPILLAILAGLLPGTVMALVGDRLDAAAWLHPLISAMSAAEGATKARPTYTLPEITAAVGPAEFCLYLGAYAAIYTALAAGVWLLAVRVCRNRMRRGS